MTLPSVKTTYTERRSPDSEHVQEARNLRQEEGQNPGLPGGVLVADREVVTVEQPQTSGVVERFNRTLKEQAIYGKVLRNIEEVRRVVGKFVGITTPSSE